VGFVNGVKDITLIS